LLAVPSALMREGSPFSVPVGYRTVIPANKRIESAVIAGLDPAIHLFAKFGEE
jgi:hypothetical protein